MWIVIITNYGNPYKIEIFNNERDAQIYLDGIQAVDDDDYYATMLEVSSQCYEDRHPADGNK